MSDVEIRMLPVFLMGFVGGGVILFCFMAFAGVLPWKKKVDEQKEETSYWFHKHNEESALRFKFEKEISALKAKLTPAPFSAIPISPEWLASDILNLQKFLTSETGEKMMKRARALEYASAVAGAQDQIHTTHSAGRTSGITDTLNWVVSCASDEMFNKLSQATGEQVAKQNPSDSEHEDAALLEKLSP